MLKYYFKWNISMEKLIKSLKYENFQVIEKLKTENNLLN